MKFTHKKQFDLLDNNALAGNAYYIYYYLFNSKGGVLMLKLLAKVAERYAKAANTACFIIGIAHQPKMPASLIKKD